MVDRRRRLLLLAIVVLAASACEYLPTKTEGWMVTLGDAVRRAEGQAWEDVAPASTILVAVPPPAPEPRCHADHPNAVDVAAAIEAHFDPDWHLWACLVVWCESRFDPGARNGPHIGLFQINRDLWADAVADLGADLWTFDGNAAVARFILDVQGRRAWQCDPW